MHDIALHANENEQYSRRNNIRIKGLSLKSNEDAQLAVHQFCRTELHCGEFWSDVMICLAELLDIQPSKITSHRPNANGVVERVHGTLHSMFGKLVSQNQRDWCELVPYVTYAYNTTLHGSTSFSPFYLTYLRRARIPIEILFCMPSEAAYEMDNTYVSVTSERM